MALLEGREDGLDAFFLVVAELDTGRESPGCREKSSSPGPIRVRLMPRDSSWERQETPRESVNHGT